MRQSILGGFQTVSSIDNLNGDSRETGKRTPAGLPDPSIFFGDETGRGSSVGTAIALMSLRPSHGGPASVRYREFWGVGKLDDLTDEPGMAGRAPWDAIFGPTYANHVLAADPRG